MATSVILAEANAAADDAAREARAEVLQRTRADEAADGGETKISKRTARASTSDKEWHKFVIDVWLTDLNPTEFGIYKRHRNRARSRQFTQDMDIYADVIENGVRTGLMGYRKTPWKENKGMDRRLIFKLFTKSMGWKATMDLMIGRSLQLTMGARGLPVTAYSINTDDDDFIIYLERSAFKLPLFPEHFSFFLMRDGKPEYFRLQRAFINVGGDYTLYDQNNNKIGYVDGQITSIAGKWKCGLKTEYADKKLLTVLKLFAAMIIFNRGARWHLWRLWKDVIAGRLQPSLEHQEADLYKNPRRVR
ncbi:MAG: hypothetical protein APF80_07350 [Alphaproteobacteria bacterium BRH_c36]|nr:MAG: hypothetical protein APF80_07350 [Alphaproteobacteria bacterium BRH_c36]